MNKYALMSIIGLLICGQVCSLWFIGNQRQTIRNQADVIEIQKETILSLHASREIIDEINVQRQEFERSLDTYTKKSYTQLRSLLQNDKKAADWANTPIPESVVEQLHESASASNSNSRAK